MQLLSVYCSVCGQELLRTRRQFSEATKFGWKAYCSISCQTIARSKKKNIVCDFPGCDNKVLKKQADLRKTKRNFCSHSCSARFYNLRKGRKTKVCPNPNCGNKFFGDNKHCSLSCIPKIESKYTKRLIVGEIVEFERIHGRIPTKKDIMRLNRVARNQFGTWNNAIKAAGFKPNPVKFARKHIANDGHKCDSLAEKIIDDWLYAKRITHKINYPYPGNLSLTADFLIKNYWIEFFGLSGQLRRYDELKDLKLNLAERYDLKLIEIYPDHLFPKNKLDVVLERLV